MAALAQDHANSRDASVTARLGALSLLVYGPRVCKLSAKVTMHAYTPETLEDISANQWFVAVQLIARPAHRAIVEQLHAYGGNVQ